MVYADNDGVYSYIMEGINKNVCSYEKYVSLGSHSKHSTMFYCKLLRLKIIF